MTTRRALLGRALGGLGVGMVAPMVEAAKPEMIAGFDPAFVHGDAAAFTLWQKWEDGKLSYCWTDQLPSQLSAEEMAEAIRIGTLKANEPCDSFVSVQYTEKFQPLRTVWKDVKP